MKEWNAIKDLSLVLSYLKTTLALTPRLSLVIFSSHPQYKSKL